MAITFNNKEYPNWHHAHLSLTTSTMEKLREGSQPQPGHFRLLTTDFQTAGRGQRGTHWEAERGKNLLFGFTFRPLNMRAAEQFVISEALALSIVTALEAFTKKTGFSIKWPNDIYYADKKIAGMLIEHNLRGDRIALTMTGVGLNVNQTAFKSDAPNPISVKQITGHSAKRSLLLTQICDVFDGYAYLLDNGIRASIHERFKARLYRREGFHPFKDKDGTFEASIVDVRPNGQLILRDKQGLKRAYTFKDVQFVV